MLIQIHTVDLDNIDASVVINATSLTGAQASDFATMADLDRAYL